MSMDYGFMDFAVSFSPVTAFPLDKRSYFESYDAAEKAASGAVEAGSTKGIYYIGQTLTVVEGGNVQFYQIQADKTLKEIGGKIEVDESQFVFDEETGKLNLYEFANAVEGAQLVKQNGKLAWIKPDTTTVEGLSTTVSALDEVINGSENDDGTRNEDGLVHRVAELETGLENTYTKDETVEKINEEIGKKIHFEAKVVTGTSEMTDPNILYLVKVEGATGEDVYKEYILIGENPTCIGETSTNLADYAKSADVTKEIEEKIAEYKATVDKALENIESDAEKNVIDSVSEEFEISEDGDRKLSIKEISQDKVIGLPEALQNLINYIGTIPEDSESSNVVEYVQELAAIFTEAIDSKVEKVEGKGLSTNDFTAEFLNKLNSIEEGAKDNIIEAIMLGNVALSVDENKTIIIPIATKASLGVVKSSEDENKVKVLEDGTMEVNSLNINKLVQDEGEFLILNGGNSASGSTEI